MINIPVYEFLGFNILKIDFLRVDEDIINKFSIHMNKSDYDSEEKIFSCLIKVKLYFNNDNESLFMFSAGFKINDEKWFNELEENARNAMFFSVVFPFVREKINMICDDSRGGFMIPIIDLKTFDISKEVVFNKMKR